MDAGFLKPGEETASMERGVKTSGAGGGLRREEKVVKKKLNRWGAGVTSCGRLVLVFVQHVEESLNMEAAGRRFCRHDKDSVHKASVRALSHTTVLPEHRQRYNYIHDRPCLRANTVIQHYS